MIKFLFLSIFALCFCSREIHVKPGDEKGKGTAINPYGSLLSGLDHVSDGGTILLHPGEYKGADNCAIIIGKSVSIIGTTPFSSTQYINCEGFDFFFRTKAAEISLNHLKISNAGDTALHFDGRNQIVKIDDVEIGDCTGIEGGAIYAGRRIDMTLTNTKLRNNNAKRGGAIYFHGGDLKMSEVTMEENSAEEFGGGLYMVGKSIEMNDVDIFYNKAGQVGGGIFIDGSDTPVVQVHLKGLISIYHNAAAEGSGFYCDACEITESLKTLRVRGNEALENGGGMFLKKSSLNMSSLHFEYNVAENGAGLFLQDCFDVRLYGGLFERNTADDNGGAAMFWNSKVNIINIKMALNGADEGAGIYCRRSELAVIGVKFEANQEGNIHCDVGCVVKGTPCSNPVNNNIIAK